MGGVCVFSCVWLCNLMVSSLAGSFGHGIILARVLEWVAISFSRGSSQPRDWTWVSSIGRQIFFFLIPLSHLSEACTILHIYYLLIKEFLSHFSSIKSFIILETVHSLRPMFSFFVWRVSATVIHHRSVWGCQHPFIIGRLLLLGGRVTDLFLSHLVLVIVLLPLSQA